MAKLNIGAEQTFILNDLHECEICKTPYEKKGRLKNHLIEKHGVEAQYTHMANSNMIYNSAYFL